MQKFNENLENIRKKVEMYLDSKKETGLVKNNRDQKFWKGKLLVDVQTWGQISATFKLKDVLKHMPIEFVKRPLPIIFDSFELHRIDCEDWMRDYFIYLVEICNEPKEGLLDRIIKW